MQGNEKEHISGTIKKLNAKRKFEEYDEESDADFLFSVH